MSAEPTESTGVLLIAHGSRRTEANEDLARLAESVKQRSPYRAVEIAYLELTEPTIPEGARRLIEQGVQRILMLPYFLSAGAHVADDLQRIRRELQQEHGGVRFVLCPPLGLHPRMLDIVLDRLEQGERTL